MKNNLLLAGGLLTITSLLSGCGQSNTPRTATATGTVAQANADALKGFQTQALNWGSCDASLIHNKLQAALGSRVQCTDLKVPMDWNNPSHGTASISLLRVTAGTAAKRQGAIFFNPGGPGGDGLRFGLIFGAIWNGADPSTKSGAAFKQLSDQYDMIGFSPRGVGDSSEISCGSSVELSPEHYQSTDRSQKNIDAMLRNAKLVADACKKSPFAPYVNTDQTARDLDLARQLMGDSKLNYIGYSYGTWLGAWYAKLFPSHTGRMLLDGNTAFDKTMQDSFNLQPLGFERDFRDVALYYAARHDDLYGLGTTKEAVYGVYDSFQPDLKLALQQYSGDNLVSSLYTDDGITTVPVQLVAARGVSILLKQHPDLTDAADLEALFADYTFAQDADTNKAAKEIAYPLAETYFSIVNEDTTPVTKNPSDAVFNVVPCNDTPWTQDPQYWINFGNQEAVAHPLIGGSFTETPCMYWSGPTTTKPATPSNLPPILMLTNEDDPATPREGAFSAWKSLPGAKMLFVDNEGEHTAFPYGTECVDYPVVNYFLNGTLPGDNFTACGALPLPGETQVYPVGETYTTGVGPQGIGQPAHIPGAIREQSLGTSSEAQAALKELKSIIHRNAFQLR